MAELHTQLNATEATAPKSPAPAPTWAQVYGIPAATQSVESSTIDNPDNAAGTNTPASPSTATDANGNVINNPKPYWWPDNTGLTQGSFHSTPYTGAPQPITQ